jgi:hypothetical protein
MMDVGPHKPAAATGLGLVWRQHIWSSRPEWRWVYRYHFEGHLKEIDIGPSTRGSDRLAQRKALALYKLICDDIDPLAQRDQTEQLLAEIDNEG